MLIKSRILWAAGILVRVKRMLSNVKGGDNLGDNWEVHICCVDEYMMHNINHIPRLIETQTFYRIDSSSFTSCTIGSVVFLLQEYKLNLHLAIKLCTGTSHHHRQHVQIVQLHFYWIMSSKLHLGVTYMTYAWEKILCIVLAWSCMAWIEWTLFSLSTCINDSY